MTRLLAALVACAAATAMTSAAPRIPLCAGLTVVTAISQSTGDYESIKTIEAVTGDRVTLKYSSETAYEDWLTGESGLAKTVVRRSVRKVDLESAIAYQQVFLGDADEMIPETTAIGVSAAVLTALKTRGASPFAISAAYPGVKLTADRNVQPSAYDFLQPFELTRVGTGTVMLPVLLNNVPVELPAVRATGHNAGDDEEFFILDDEQNPLMLKFRMGINGWPALDQEQLWYCDVLKKGGQRPEASIQAGFNCALPKGGDRNVLRVIKIESRCDGRLPAAPGGGGGAGTGAGLDVAAPAALERQLAETRRADVYSIYFTFNSDVIRPESEPTLEEIAAVLTKHGDWNLRIDGHTDGIGGDQQNLDLSRRRAAAVKNALTKRYQVPVRRLTTGGYGRSRPKDTNDTIEGRARNRRVELARTS